METSCKVCGGPHITGACTEKKNSENRGLTDYSQVTTAKVAEHFKARAELFADNADNATANTFFDIADSFDEGNVPTKVDLQKALKELQEQDAYAQKFMAGDDFEGKKTPDLGVIYGDHTSVDSMIRFLREEIGKMKK